MSRRRVFKLTKPENPATDKHPGAALGVFRKYFGDGLRKDSCRVGTKFPRTISLIYLDDVTDSELVAEMGRRLRAIKMDLPQDLAQTARRMTDGAFRLFPGFRKAAGPPEAAAALCHGQLLMSMDEESCWIILPVTLLDFFEKSSSSAGAWTAPGVLFRLSAFAAAAFLPAIYVAVTSFQYYAVPVKLFFLIAESRLRVPFPPGFEILLLEALIEMVREAARKLTPPTGAILTMSGGLLIAAGLAGTGLIGPVASFFGGAALVASLAAPLPELRPAMRRLIFGSIIMTMVFGILGMVIVASLTVAVLVSLETVERPYLQSGNRIKKWHV